MSSTIAIFLAQDGIINGAIYALLGVTLVEETFNPVNGETKEVGVWSKSNNAAVPQLGDVRVRVAQHDAPPAARRLRDVGHG